MQFTAQNQQTAEYNISSQDNHKPRSTIAVTNRMKRHFISFCLDTANNHLAQGCPNLVRKVHYPAYFRCFSDPTHLILISGILKGFCRT